MAVAAVARRRRGGRAVEPRRRGGRRSRGSCPGRTRRARAARSSGDEESVPCLVVLRIALHNRVSIAYLKYATHKPQSTHGHERSAPLFHTPLTPCSNFTLSFVHRAAADHICLYRFRFTAVQYCSAFRMRDGRCGVLDRSKIVLVQTHTRARH